jgi:molybdenum cofactor biosynthesis enzyme MoaA
MRANNLTISIPDNGCDKNCPYCISRITGEVKPDGALMVQNIPKVKTLARAAQVASVLLTSKGEPFCNLIELLYIARAFKEWPIEVQTNGMWICRSTVCCGDLKKAGVDVVGISVDRDLPPKEAVLAMRDVGLVVRVTVNITKMLDDIKMEDLLDRCTRNGIQQVSLRRVMAPHGSPPHSREVEWIEKNAPLILYETCKSEAKKLCSGSGGFIRRMPHGMSIWDYKGVSVCFIDECIQEQADSEDIRSLIFMEDGHLYTSWNSTASILF